MFWTSNSFADLTLKDRVPICTLSQRPIQIIFDNCQKTKIMETAVFGGFSGKTTVDGENWYFIFLLSNVKFDGRQLKNSKITGKK